MLIHPIPHLTLTFALILVHIHSLSHLNPHSYPRLILYPHTFTHYYSPTLIYTLILILFLTLIHPLPCLHTHRYPNPQLYPRPYRFPDFLMFTLFQLSLSSPSFFGLRRTSSSNSLHSYFHILLSNSQYHFYLIPIFIPILTAGLAVVFFVLFPFWLFGCCFCCCPCTTCVFEHSRISFL